MTHRRIIPRVLILLGLVLCAMILTMMATVTLVQAQDPSITITKDADQPVIKSGSTVTFTIGINNTGGVTLTDVIVSDPQASNCDKGIGELDDLVPGGSTSYKCTREGVTADFTNSATVTGTSVLTGTDFADDTDTAFVDVISPAIEISKTPDTQTIVSGDTVIFNITVQNTGDVDLDNVNLTDAQCVLSSPSGDIGSDGVLSSPGETWSYTCTAEDVTADFTNSATVTGTDTLLSIEVTDTDTAFVDVISPAIEIVKTPDEQTVASGSDVIFNITVQNTGDADLDNVNLTDAQCNVLSGPSGDTGNDGILSSPGETWNYTCTVEDVTDGFINSATVTGSPAAGEDVTDADAAKVRLDETGTCPTDLLAYWKLDETSSGAYDDFYYGHDGGCAGSCPTPTTGGHVNGGQVFDGSNTGIDVPAVPGDDSFNWGAGDSFSIEFWMQSDSGACSGSNEVIIGRDDSATELHWWVGCWRNSGQAAFYLKDKSGTLAGTMGITDLMDESWHHVVAVRDGSANAIRVYVDGTEENSTPATYTTGFDSPTAALNIGWLNWSGGYHFGGTVDEIAVYNGALSANEVQQHYGEGLAGRWYCQGGTYAPFIFSTPVTEAATGLPYTYDVDAVGNPVPTYALVTTPTGMTIDTATGLISWTPKIAQVGSHAVEVEASNSVGTDTQDFTIIVTEGTICPADLLAYWKLDETSSGAYNDFYDGHDGGCAGDCPDPATGYINGGQEFDGSSTWIDVPADAAFDWGAGDSFSIEFWMQAGSSACVGSNEVIIGRDDSATPLHWWVGCWVGGQAAFYLEDTSGVIVSVTGATVTGGAWHHVVAVRDAGASEIRIYVDAWGSSASATGLGSLASTAALNIGWLNLSSGFHFDGIIDEVALYDRALSPDEIQQHYNEAGPGYCISPDIAVDKTANLTVIGPGDTVIYTYIVTNPGDTPLSNVNVSDDKCSPVTPSGGGDGNGNSKLDPTETWTYTCSTALSTDTTNTAIVTGSYATDSTVSDTDTAFVGVEGGGAYPAFLPLILKTR